MIDSIAYIRKPLKRPVLERLRRTPPFFPLKIGYCYHCESCMKLVYIPFNDVILELATWSVPKWVDTKKSKWICDTETNKPYYTSKLNPLRNPAHCVQEDCSRGVYFLSYNYLPPPPRWKIIFSLDIMCFCEISKKY